MWRLKRPVGATWDSFRPSRASAVLSLCWQVAFLPCHWLSPHIYPVRGVHPVLRCWRTSRGVGGAPRACLLRYQVTAPPLPAPCTTTPRVLDTLTRWRMGVASFGTFSTFLVSSLVSATLGYMLRTRFETTPCHGAVPVGMASLTGVLLSTRGFLDLGFAPVAGYLADRWGQHRVIATAMSMSILMVAALALHRRCGA